MWRWVNEPQWFCVLVTAFPETPEAMILEHTPTSVTFQIQQAVMSRTLPTIGYRISTRAVVQDFGIGETFLISDKKPNKSYSRFSLIEPLLIGTIG